MMDCSNLYPMIDAKPFVPFTIELSSGRVIQVTHPENIAVLPTRNRVHHIEVYRTDPFDMAIIWPESLVALSYPAPDAPAA